MAVRRVKLRYFLIVLVPIVIFWTNSIITGHLVAADLEVTESMLRDDRPWLESVGRYRFLAATWFFLSLAVLAVALLVRDLMAPLTRDTRIAAIATMGVVVFLAITPSLQHLMDPDARRVYDRIGSAVFETALSRGSLPGCSGPEDRWLLGLCGEIPVLSLFNRTLDIVNVFAGLGVGALIVSMILCLQTHATRDVEEEAALLAQNLRKMRQQLYLSGVVITFGMFFATSWMYWPVPLVVESEQAAYGSVVLSLALFTGIYFSLLLLSFYLPVALILDARVRRLAGLAGAEAKGGKPLDIDDWRRSRGLKEGAADYMRAGFALTAPILAAFAGGISPIAL